ncbi:MAG: hypothetical protein II124_00440 [Clostridia bacterium]|nr:hypothetical protein [Clostridia bacterium]
MKSAVIFILILTFILPLAACLGPVSIDEYGYVISIGIDEGKTKKHYFVFALQRELTEADAQNEGGAVILAEEADGFDEAVAAIEARVPYALSFSRVGFFVFSGKAAQNGALSLLRELSFDSLKVRASAAVMISEGTVVDFLGGLSANNDANVSKIQTAVMLDSRMTGRVTVMSAARLFESMDAGSYGFCAPIGTTDPDIVTSMSEKKTEAEGEDPLEQAEPNARIGGLKTYLSGTALFSGLVMTGVLDREQTMYLNLANGEFKTGTVSLDTPDGEYTFVITLLSAKRRVKREEDSAVGIELRLAAAVHSAPGPESPDTLDKVMTELLPSELEKRLSEVASLAHEAGCDAMRMGLTLLRGMHGTAPVPPNELRALALSVTPEFRLTVVNAESADGL